LRIVVSVVAEEFGALARTLADQLEQAGHDVLILPGDHAGEVPLTDRVTYIDSAGALVCVVGERCGAFPAAREVAALGDVAYQYNFRSDTGSVETSYLHWDLLLACQDNVPVLILRPGAGCPPDTRNPERSDRQADQRSFRHWLRLVELPEVTGFDPATLAAAAMAVLTPTPAVAAE
jgi:hypothetical protein